jgi:hypothetical protein
VPHIQSAAASAFVPGGADPQLPSARGAAPQAAELLFDEEPEEPEEPEPEDPDEPEEPPEEPEELVEVDGLDDSVPLFAEGEVAGAGALADDELRLSVR